MSSETSTSVTEDQGFQVSHFFMLVSLLAATVAVVMARPSAPEHLILISLTIGAAGLTGLCVYRMLAPLVAPHADLDRQPLSERTRLDLEREKALTLRSIKELEFDRAMDKVSAQDFEEITGRLRARAVGIMKQLDAGAGAYRELIEKELAARVGIKPAIEPVTAERLTAEPLTAEPVTPGSVTGESVTRGPGTVGPVTMGPVTVGPAAVGPVAVGPVAVGPVAVGPVTRGPDLQVGQCACGTSNDADARFCKSCGEKLKVAS